MVSLILKDKIVNCSWSTVIVVGCRRTLPLCGSRRWTAFSRKYTICKCSGRGLYYCNLTHIEWIYIYYTLQIFFHDDGDSNAFGIMKKGKFIPKSDFKMDFVMTVEALENTGYIVNVTRHVDNQTRWEVLSSCDGCSNDLTCMTVVYKSLQSWAIT